MTDLPLVIELTILVLAAFLGFEVISKVPTMLHTPLMSGDELHPRHRHRRRDHRPRRRRRHVHEGRRLRRDGARDRERRRRLVRDRPHARDVQAAAGAAEGGRQVISDPDVVGLLYLVTIVCFVLALRFLSSPKHARTRELGRRRRDARRDRDDAARSRGSANWALIVVGGCDRQRRRARRSAQGEDDRDAADGRHLQRGRRRGGGARRARGVARTRRRARVGRERCRSSLSALIGSISFAGSLGRLREAPGARQRTADRLPGPEHRQRPRPRSPPPRSGSRSSRARGAVGARRAHRPRARLRRDVRAARSAARTCPSSSRS